LNDYRTSLPGFGILKNISKKTLKQMGIAALTILLVYLPKNG
jgi:hypothetical protein